MKPNIIWIARCHIAPLGIAGLAAYGGGDAGDPRPLLMVSCETSQGIGWTKREP